MSGAIGTPRGSRQRRAAAAPRPRSDRPSPPCWASIFMTHGPNAGADGHKVIDIGLGRLPSVAHATNRLDAQLLDRKARTAVIVAEGASSINQWPAFGMTSSVTSVAALRIT